MGGWSELCLICGLTPGGGPKGLFYSAEDCLEEVTKALEAQNVDLGLNIDQIREEIMKVLPLFEQEDQSQSSKTRYEQAILDGSLSPDTYFPFASQDWDGWAAIAIGTFDEDGEPLVTMKNGVRIPPRGFDVTTRLVKDNGDNYTGGNFSALDDTPENMQVYTSASSGLTVANFFCLRAPYHYLKSWVNRDTLPPRQTAFPLEPDMSFEGELYEIINTRRERRDEASGILNWVDYGGITKDFHQFQDYFWIDDAFYLGQALKSGLRGKDLIPALLRDFSVWQTCPTNRWVKAVLSDSSSIDIQPSEVSEELKKWDKLPTEIRLEIFANVSIPDFFAFTSSCRYFHLQFGNHNFVSSLMRTQLRRPLSSLHWFLPVTDVKGEVETFCHACNESRTPESETPSQMAEGIPMVFDPNFPLFQYVRTNWITDSMKNRRRIWRITQQFRQEWYKYRTEGYEYNIFEEGNRSSY